MNESSTSRQVSSIRPEKHLIQEQFSGAVVQQYQSTGNLAHQFLLAKCAMLGLYFIVLKLLTGTVTIDVSLVTITAFICWSVSIVCTVFAIIPPQSETKLDFDQAIQQKQALLIPSLVLFITGFLIIFWNLLI